MSNWYVYMIRCVNKTLYTGITSNVDRRFAEHQSSGPRAARYLKGKGPLQLVFSTETEDRASALRLEQTIKKLSKAQKERLVQRPETMQEVIEKIPLAKIADALAKKTKDK